MKLYKYGKDITIMRYILLGLLLLGIIVLICVYPQVEVFVVLGLFGALLLVVLLVSLISSFFVEFDSQYISEKNVFGIIKRKKELKDLKEISIVMLSPSVYTIDYYLSFNFSDKDYTNYSMGDLLREDDVIILAYREKYMEKLKQYIKLPIIDRRKDNSKKDV